jgi:hypothetical protein
VFFWQLVLKQQLWEFMQFWKLLFLWKFVFLEQLWKFLLFWKLVFLWKLLLELFLAPSLPSAHHLHRPPTHVHSQASSLRSVVDRFRALDLIIFPQFH